MRATAPSSWLIFATNQRRDCSFRNHRFSSNTHFEVLYNVEVCYITSKFPKPPFLQLYPLRIIGRGDEGLLTSKCDAGKAH